MDNNQKPYFFRGLESLNFLRSLIPMFFAVFLLYVCPIYLVFESISFVLKRFDFYQTLQSPPIALFGVYIESPLKLSFLFILVNLILLFGALAFRISRHPRKYQFMMLIGRDKGQLSLLGSLSVIFLPVFALIDSFLWRQPGEVIFKRLISREFPQADISKTLQPLLNKWNLWWRRAILGIVVFVNLCFLSVISAGTHFAIESADQLGRNLFQMAANKEFSQMLTVLKGNQIAPEIDNLENLEKLLANDSFTVGAFKLKDFIYCRAPMCQAIFSATLLGKDTTLNLELGMWVGKSEIYPDFIRHDDGKIDQNNPVPIAARKVIQEDFQLIRSGSYKMLWDRLPDEIKKRLTFKKYKENFQDFFKGLKEPMTLEFMSTSYLWSSYGNFTSSQALVKSKDKQVPISINLMYDPNKSTWHVINFHTVGK